MKLLILIASLFQMVAVSTATAEINRVEKPTEEYLAIATANTVNRLGTVGNYLKWLSLRSPKAEVDRLEKYLLAVGVSKTQKFPRLKAIGSKVYFSRSEFMTYSTKDITVDGRKFVQQQAPIDEVVQSIVDKLQRPRAAWYSLMMPQAHAMSSSVSSALIGLVAGGALGYFAGPSMGMSNTQGALAGALLGGVAGLGVNYLGSESSYYMGNNGSVVCNGNNYYIQNGTGSYLGQSNTAQQQVPPGVVMQMYNGPRPCNATNAGYMQTTYTNWNQPAYLTSFNQQQQQHPGTILGVAQ